LEHSVT